MKIPARHIPKYSKRSISGVILTVVFLMISFSPLVSLSIHAASETFTSRIECSGDCDICGCPPDSRSAGTCCCSKKRAQQHIVLNDEAGQPDCCKKVPADKTTVVISCGYPCGSGKSFLPSGCSAHEALPYYYTEQCAPSPVETDYSTMLPQLFSRHIEPPDPPPKIVL